MKNIPEILVFFWYRNAEDYERLRALSEDGGQLMDSYARWLQAAENGVEEITRISPGRKIVKVDVDPDEYLPWCRAGGRKINAESRNGFSSLKAASEALRNLE